MLICIHYKWTFFCQMLSPNIIIIIQGLDVALQMAT